MKRVLPILCVASFLAVAMLLASLGLGIRPAWWFTPAQRADRLLERGEFAQAAAASADPARQGTAFYREGAFKEAALAFARDPSAAGAFNRANALLMQGKYDDAIKSYDRALSLKAPWQEAQDNRSIAMARRDRLQTEGGDVTGGQVKADKIVFGKGQNQAGETVQVDAGEPLSDEQLRAVWLRQVQTKPADFLRAKFAFQVQDASAQGEQ